MQMESTPTAVEATDFDSAVSTPLPLTVVGLDLSARKTTVQLITVPRAERENLSAPDREKIRNHVIQALQPAFSTNADLIKQTNQGHSFLANSLDFQKQVKNLKVRLMAYSVADVFTLYLLDTNGQPIKEEFNLLDSYSKVTLEHALANSSMYSYYGDEVTMENLIWSKELILASCDNDLRARIETQMATLPVDQDTGPIAFYYLATFIVSTSDSVARAIVTKLSTMRLAHFPGEDVALMAATVRGAAARLNSCGRLPGDMNEIVADILDSATSFKFRSEFDTLRTMRNPVVADWDRMLDRACELYHDLTLKGRWAPLRKQGASFVGQNTPTAAAATTAPPASPKQLATHDRKGQLIDRKPPKPGESTTRTKNGKEEHWCAHCDWLHGRWGNHKTNDHQSFVDKQRSLRKKRKENKKSANTPLEDDTKPDPQRRTRFHIPEANLASSLTLSRVGTVSPF